MVSMAQSTLFPLAVTGLGMTSPLGLDVITSCAAARASISRAGAIDGFQVWNPETCEPEDAIGHVIQGFTDGFRGVGRLVRLGAAALSDLASRVAPTDWRRTGLFINLSNSFHVQELHRSVEGAGASAVLGRAGVEQWQARCEAQVAHAIGKLARIPVQQEHTRLFFEGQVGVLQAIREAERDLREGRLMRCIIGGIDCNVEPELLAVLAQLNLLKTPENPAGVLPGECAAFFMLEMRDTGRARGAQADALIEPPSVTREPFHRLSRDPPTGSALFACISEVIRCLEDGGRKIGLVLADLDGSDYRARDWGHALVRLRASGALRDVPEWYPSLHFGAVGAASGALAVCLATRAFARRYACTSDVLVWLAGDEGARGALYLRAAPTMEK